MANFSLIGLAQIDQAQAQKEVTANAAIEALAKSTGALSKSVAAGGTISLTDDESRYRVALLTGAPGSTTTIVQSVNVTSITLYRNDTTGGQTIQVKQNGGTAFTVPPGAWVLVINGTTAETFFTGIRFSTGTQAMADANQTPAASVYNNRRVVTTGALTAQRNLVLPVTADLERVIVNQCTGFGVQVIGASGTGIVVGAGKTAILYCDGTNWTRVTADV